MARLTVATTDPLNAPVDPASVVLKIKTPAGVIVNQAYPGLIVRTGVGLYQFDLLLTETGRWRYRWETSAPAQSAAQGDVTVAPDNM